MLCIASLIILYRFEKYNKKKTALPVAGEGGF
jgi:hypothetical protein